MKPVGQEIWSFDVAFDGVSTQMVDRLNIFEVGGRSSVNLGARYRFNVAGSKVLLRGQVLNLLNDYGWRVSSSGGFSFSLPRTVYLQMVADF